jgi:GT2 family glycosyltransferase
MIVPTLLNSDGTLQPSRHSFPTINGITRKFLAKFKRFFSQPSTDIELHVDWATGACWFLPVSMFETIGGLDTNLFMYGEDLDYCWRVHQAGFEIVWAPQIQVIHHSNISGQQKWGDQRLLKTYQGLIYFWLKYFSLTYTIAMILIRVSYILVRALLDLATRITGLLLSRSSEECGGQLGQITALIRACFDRDAWPIYHSALQYKK